jgi:hypothetical protein
MTRAFLLVVALAAVALAAAKPAPPKPAPPTFKAGFARATITPKVCMWMSGYSARKKPSDGVAQDLFSKAVAIEDETGGRLVIVTNDLIGIRRELRDAVEKRVAEQFKLPPERLVLNASHTHCGPEYRGSKPEAKEYYQFLEDTLVRIIGEAIANLQPARLSFAHARAGFAMNRRRNYALPTGDQNANMAPTFDGPVDHEVPVLKVEDAGGKIVGLLVGYACHNTSLSSTSLDPKNPVYEFTGDYAGNAQLALEKLHPGATAMFVMGCGGDQNPYPRHNAIDSIPPLEWAKFHGQTLAYAAEAALLTGPRPVTGKITAAWGDVELTRNGDKGTKLLPVQAIRFGTYLTMITLGSEDTVEYSLRLKKELGGDPVTTAVWVAGYSNDYAGYIPSAKVAKEGGYEAQGDYTPDVEDRIIAKVHEVLKQVK